MFVDLHHLALQMLRGGPELSKKSKKYFLAEF
jgi:hypothetical protein